MAHQTINLKAVKFGYVDEEHPYEHYPVTADGRYYVGGSSSSFDRKFFYIGFEPLPTELDAMRIYGAQLTLRADASTEGERWMDSANIFAVEDFDEESLTFASKPDYTSTRDGWYLSFQNTASATVYETTGRDVEYLNSYIMVAVYALRSGAISVSETYGSHDFLGVRSVLADGSLPYLTVHYDDTDILSGKIRYKSGPIGGAYSDPRYRTTFSWEFEKASSSYECVKTVWRQKSATFYWKVSGTEQWNSIEADSTTLVVPADTFPTASTIIWYVEGTEDTGTTTKTSQYSFSTSDSTAYATPVSPVDSAVDGSKPITFSWNLTNASGSVPALVNFWWKLPTEDNQHWHAIINSTDPIISYTVPADYFPSGEIQWLVRASNKDGTVGPAGIASFVCVASPSAPVGIECDGKPFSTLVWQSAEQQAYRIVVNGEEVVKAFGTEKTYTLETPLADGEYTAEIYVQGLYGLWSNAGAISFSVKNLPGAAVTLTGIFDVDAELTWTTEDDAHDFYVYRDGVRIGRTEKTACADRLALGEHGYYVLNRLADNNYTKSNLVHGVMESEETRIRPLDDNSWTTLKLSSVSASQQAYKYERQHAARHITGARFPLLEMSEFEDEAVSLDVAFTERINIRIFEAMKGKVVVIKCRGDNVIVGPMVSLQKVVGDFFTSYSFAIQRIDYEDVVNVQDD